MKIIGWIVYDPVTGPDVVGGGVYIHIERPYVMPGQAVARVEIELPMPAASVSTFLVSEEQRKEMEDEWAVSTAAMILQLEQDDPDKYPIPHAAAKEWRKRLQRAGYGMDGKRLDGVEG